MGALIKACALEGSDTETQRSGKPNYCHEQFLPLIFASLGHFLNSQTAPRAALPSRVLFIVRNFSSDLLPMEKKNRNKGLFDEKWPSKFSHGLDQSGIPWQGNECIMGCSEPPSQGSVRRRQGVHVNR